jgi:RNA polymerase sigma factor (sigma-70 family)
MMTETRQLLVDYARNGSEVAFTELVSRYLDLVFSTALRLVGGDNHMAEDVAQTVFMDLARQASKLSENAMLGGWLHRDTCFVAAKIMRAERRRQHRERQAAEMNALNNSEVGFAQAAPILDEVINQLTEEDRQAILLRFYERMDLRSVGQALGSTENAAQKRVSRALDQLHNLLSRRGVALSAAALGAGLASEGVTAAPVGLTASITGTVLASATAGMSNTVTLTKALVLTKTKLAIFGAILVGAMTAPILLQHQDLVRLRTQNESFRHQLEGLPLVVRENASLSNQLPQVNNTASLPKEQSSELLRLRGEVARLRRQAQELAQAKPAVSALEEPGAALDEKERAKKRAAMEAQAIVAGLDIKYVGPAAVNEEAVRTNIWTRVGDLFESATVDDDVRRLNATGLFRNIRVADQAQDRGRSLTYVVQCKPRLGDIKFAGSAKFKDAQLLEQISSKVGQAVDDRNLSDDGERIRSIYEQAGFKSPGVKYAFDLDEPSGLGTVTFEITEKP